jgi:hypothetical protein
MNTNCAFTSGASPPHIFVLYKYSHTEFLNIIKIFDHAHIVFGVVSCIQMFQIVAGEISAFKTNLCIVFSEHFAGLDFTSNTGDRFISIRSSAAGAFIFFSQISHANAAVHSAGGYKRKFIQGFHSLLFYTLLITLIMRHIKLTSRCFLGSTPMELKIIMIILFYKP